MAYFEAKIPTRFRPELRPRPAAGAYSAPRDPIAKFQKPTAKGKEGEGRGYRTGW